MCFPAKTEEKGQIETLPMIGYEDIAKLDIRVGKVLLAEPIKKSKKKANYAAGTVR